MCCLQGCFLPSQLVPWPQAVCSASPAWLSLQLWLPWLSQEQLSNAQPALQLGEFMMSVMETLSFYFLPKKTL